MLKLAMYYHRWSWLIKLGFLKESFQMTAMMTEKAHWDGHRKFTFYWEAKIKKMKVNHTHSAILTAEAWKNKTTPDSSRSSTSSNGQPAGVRPSRNLLYRSCHVVLFLRYLKKKKMTVTVDDTKWSFLLSFENINVCGPKKKFRIAPTKKQPQWHQVSKESKFL